MVIRIFIAYSLEEKEEVYLNEILKDFKMLKKKYGNKCKLETFHKGNVRAGDDISAMSNLSLSEADIFLLLINRTFLADITEDPLDTEFQAIVRKHENGAIVLPILLTRSLFNESIFKNLSTLPLRGKPISKWDDKDDAYTEISKGIMVRIDAMIEEKNKRLDDDPKIRRMQIKSNDKGKDENALNFIDTFIFDKFFNYKISINGKI